MSTAIEDNTKRIFQNQKGFKAQITKIFRDINIVRTVERNLENLKQTGLVTVYIAEFQQYASKLDWNNTSKRAQYYKGLKDSIKDNITIAGKLDKLDDLVRLSIKIDA